VHSLDRKIGASALSVVSGSTSARCLSTTMIRERSPDAIENYLRHDRPAALIDPSTDHR